MSLLARLRAVGSSEPERVCRLCGLRFERDPPNCPACGGAVEPVR